MVAPSLIIILTLRDSIVSPDEGGSSEAAGGGIEAGEWGRCQLLVRGRPQGQSGRFRYGLPLEQEEPMVDDGW